MKKYYLPALFLIFFTAVSFVGTSQIIVSANVSNCSCYLGSNGSVTVLASGGAVPYLYYLNSMPTPQANNVFTGLSAGVYVATVMDANSNSASVSFTIIDGPELTANATTLPTTCNSGDGGSITVIPTSGTAPYNFQFDDGTTVYTSTGTEATFNQGHLYAGDYLVQFTDADGCVGATSVQIADGDSLRGTYNVWAPSCLSAADALLQFNFSNGVEPFTIYNASLSFLIDGAHNSAANPNEWLGIFAAGNYHCTVQDSIGCVGEIDIIIPAGLPAFTHVGNDTVVCGQAGIQVTVTDNGTLQSEGFEWQPTNGVSDPVSGHPVLNPASTTTYTVTSASTWNTGSYCITSDTITIFVVNLDIPVIQSNGTELSVTNVQNNVSYTWQEQNGNDWTNVGTGTSFTSSSANPYRVEASAAGCVEYSSSTIINRTASANPYGIYSFPNPATDVFTLEALKLEDGWTTLDVFDMFGNRVVSPVNINNRSNASVNVSRLNSGIYTVKLTGADGKTTRFRFMKR
ncbi:MAG: T9SS type A sorting domain-containing protein [Bacteroidetes bacterium]|nr:T9SS type A sorting domain-containing protein [Bacteroidota bacterium]